MNFDSDDSLADESYDPNKHVEESESEEEEFWSSSRKPQRTRVHSTCPVPAGTAANATAPSSSKFPPAPPQTPPSATATSQSSPAPAPIQGPPFSCVFDDCNAKFARTYNLKAHCKKIHNQVPESIKNMKTERYTCDGCGGNFSNLRMHKPVCRGPKQQSAAAASGSSLTGVKNISVDSDDLFFSKFKEYCSGPQGGLSETSIKIYITRILQFSKHTKSLPEFSGFSLGKIGNVHCANQGIAYCDLPSLSSWVRYDLNSNEQKLQGAAAYLKLCDYLQYLIAEVGFVISDIPKAELSIRQSHIIGMRKIAKDFMGATQKNIVPDRQARREDQAALAETESEQKIPMDEMERLNTIYGQSEFRKSMYEKLVDMEAAVHEGKTSIVEIRNFLMLELLISSKGMRSDVIINMTFGEFYGAKSMEIQGVPYKVILVKEHKTKSSKGPMQVFITKSQYALVCQYNKTIRPQLCKVEDPIDGPVFVTQSGAKFWELSCAMSIFKKVTKTVHQVTPRDFRYLWAKKGQDSKDPEVQEKFPEMMGHSKATAQKSYIKQADKISKHADFHSKLGTGVENIEATFSAQMIDEEEAKTMELRRTRYIEEQKQKKDANFRPGGRRVFDFSEREIIKKTFLFVQEKTLNMSDYKKGRSESKEFNELVKKHLATGKTEMLVRTQVQNSFRAMYRQQ